MQSHGAIARRNAEPNAGLTRGLGLFSVGLGIAELAAPRVFARAIGIDPHGRTSTTIRAMGARELLNGLGILMHKDRVLAADGMTQLIRGSRESIVNGARYVQEYDLDDGDLSLLDA